MNTESITKEQHNKMAAIENMLWEIAKIISPNDYIDPQVISKAKEKLLDHFNAE